MKDSARSSFLAGVARLLDIGGVSNPQQKSVPAAIEDSQAMHSDWEMVGSDLRQSMRRMDRELSIKKK